MSNLLPTNFVGTTGAAVQTADGDCWVCFQNKDYQIYEMMLNDPASPSYTLANLTATPFPTPRINTPIAAVSWNNLKEICVYHIIADSQVQEIGFTRGRGWSKGPVLGTAVETSAFLYAQVATSPAVLVRVGFQSSTAPQTITEAVYDNG
ncbi:hypothetical protein F4604DRAFT_1614920 [Suillus subluteus]|nr:hypothetical protein F4604DRAFT_1614920 [Suillus subluteus]